MPSSLLLTVGLTACAASTAKKHLSVPVQRAVPLVGGKPLTHPPECLTILGVDGDRCGLLPILVAPGFVVSPGYHRVRWSVRDPEIADPSHVRLGKNAIRRLEVVAAAECVAYVCAFVDGIAGHEVVDILARCVLKGALKGDCGRRGGSRISGEGIVANSRLA